METLFNGQVVTSYRLFAISWGEGSDPFGTEGPAYRGQNGHLLGAAEGQGVSLPLPNWRGGGRVIVQLLDGPPDEPGDHWEDVDEVSVVLPHDGASLVTFDGEWDDIAIPAGTWRLRVCSHGRDAAAELEWLDDDPEPPDEHLFQFWRAPWSEDRVVRRGSDDARYWDSARGADDEGEGSTHEGLADQTSQEEDSEDQDHVAALLSACSVPEDVWALRWAGLVHPVDVVRRCAAEARHPDLEQVGHVPLDALEQVDALLRAAAAPALRHARGGTGSAWEADQAVGQRVAVVIARAVLAGLLTPRSGMRWLITALGPAEQVPQALGIHGDPAWQEFDADLSDQQVREIAAQAVAAWDGPAPADVMTTDAVADALGGLSGDDDQFGWRLLHRGVADLPDGGSVVLVAGVPEAAGQALRDAGHPVATAAVTPPFRLDADDATADLLVAGWALDELDGPGIESAFADIARVLRPDGLAFVALHTEPFDPDAPMFGQDRARRLVGQFRRGGLEEAMSASDPGDGGRPGTALYLLRPCDDAVRQAWSQPLDDLAGCFVEVTVVPNDAVPDGLVVDVDLTDGGPWPPADDDPGGDQSANWEW